MLNPGDLKTYLQDAYLNFKEIKNIFGELQLDTQYVNLQILPDKLFKESTNANVNCPDHIITHKFFHKLLQTPL